MHARLEGGRCDGLAETIADVTDAAAVVLVLVEQSGKVNCSANAPMERTMFLALAKTLHSIADKMAADAAELPAEEGKC